MGVNDFQQGLNFFREKKYSKAIEIFQAITETDESNHKVWNALGVTFTKMNQYSNASVCYENALLLDPGNETYKKNAQKNLDYLNNKPKNKKIIDTPEHTTRSTNKPNSIFDYALFLIMGIYFLILLGSIVNPLSIIALLFVGIGLLCMYIGGKSSNIKSSDYIAIIIFITIIGFGLQSSTAMHDYVNGTNINDLSQTISSTDRLIGFGILLIMGYYIYQKRQNIGIEKFQNSSEKFFNNSENPGVSKRLFAFIIDFVITMIIWWIFSFIFGIVLSIIYGAKIVQQVSTSNSFTIFSILAWGIIFIIYTVLCEKSKRRTTIGKDYNKLLVVESDGTQLSLNKSILRSIIIVISVFFAGMPFLAVFLNPNKKAIHDFILNTKVIFNY